MFKLFLAAPTMLELKAKLQEAADHINDPNAVQVAEDLGYDTNPNHAESSTPEPKQDFAEGAHLATDRDDDPVPEDENTGDDSGELDARGFPWDKRIHAATKAKTKDGSWRYRRGVTDDEIKEIEKKLKASLPAAQDTEPTPQLEMPAPSLVPPPPPPTVPVAVPVFQQPVAQPVPVAAPPMYTNIPMPPVQAAKPAHTFETFKANIIPLLAQLVSSGALTQQYLQELATYFGVDQVWKVKDDDAKAREMFENFVAAGLITRVG